MQNQSIVNQQFLLIIILSVSIFIFNTCGVSAAGLFVPRQNEVGDKDSAPGDGTLSDVNIFYVGRWDKSNKQVFHSYWSGAYLRVVFTGQSVGIRLAEGTSLIVSIDGETPRAVQGRQGVTQLNNILLSEGSHELLVGAAGQNEELLFQGLTLDAGAVTYKPKSKLLIEYIGDSLTAGTGPEGTSAVNYAWNTAEALGCDHTRIAFSGLSLTTGYGCLEKKVGMDSLYFNLKNYNHLNEKPVVAWDFSYTPDVVFILLGTNDKCGNASDAVVMKSITAFLARIRGVYPAAPIVVMRPFNGSYKGPLSTAVRKMNEADDRRVYYFDTEGWLDEADYSDGTHPNAEGGRKIVDRLLPLLSPIVEDVNGLKPVSQDGPITISPNPFDDRLNIRSEVEITTAMVRDLIGKPVALFSVDDKSTSLDLDHLLTGNYLLTLTLAGGGSITEMVMKYPR